MIHFYRFDIAQYERETKHLTFDECGIYVAICNYYLSNDASPLPIDLSLICKRICPTIKPSRSIPKIQHVLDETFLLTSDGYINKRLQNISKKIEKYTEQICG